LWLSLEKSFQPDHHIEEHSIAYIGIEHDEQTNPEQNLQ